MRNDIRGHNDIRGYTRIYVDIRGTGIYMGIWEYTGIHTDIRGYTDICKISGISGDTH